MPHVIVKLYPGRSEQAEDSACRSNGQGRGHHCKVIPHRPKRAAAYCNCATIVASTADSLRRRPNFSVLVIHRVVLAKLTTRKSDGFVLSCKRTHRLAARTHEAPHSRQ